MGCKIAPIVSSVWEKREKKCQKTSGEDFFDSHLIYFYPPPWTEKYDLPHAMLTLCKVEAV